MKHESLILFIFYHSHTSRSSIRVLLDTINNDNEYSYTDF